MHTKRWQQEIWILERFGSQFVWRDRICCMFISNKHILHNNSQQSLCHNNLVNVLILHISTGFTMYMHAGIFISSFPVHTSLSIIIVVLGWISMNETSVIYLKIILELFMYL